MRFYSGNWNLPISWPGLKTLLEPFLVPSVDYDVCPADCGLYGIHFPLDCMYCPKCRYPRNGPDRKPMKQFRYCPIYLQLVRDMSIPQLAYSYRSFFDRRAMLKRISQDQFIYDVQVGADC